VVGGVSFNPKPQAQAWLNQTGGLASDFVLLALDPCRFLAWAHVNAEVALKYAKLAKDAHSYSAQEVLTRLIMISLSFGERSRRPEWVKMIKWFQASQTIRLGRTRRSYQVFGSSSSVSSKTRETRWRTPSEATCMVKRRTLPLPCGPT